MRILIVNDDMTRAIGEVLREWIGKQPETWMAQSAREACIILFGHNERTYTREYVSMFIRRLSARTLRKAVSTHALRHSWFTNRLHEDPGLLKEISSYGGHASASTTVDLYLRGTFRAPEVLSRFHDYTPAVEALA